VVFIIGGTVASNVLAAVYEESDSDIASFFSQALYWMVLATITSVIVWLCFQVQSERRKREE